MLGICVQQNSKDTFACKMDFESWAVKYKVQEFLQTLNAFEKLTIHFCQIAPKQKNPKIDEFKKALQTFHNLYYHEFLYHNTHRTPECRDFIKSLREFEQIKKPKKSVANPGTIKRIAAKAIAAPDIISYAGTSFLTLCENPDLKVLRPSYFA